jgi:hypothetical protein
MDGHLMTHQRLEKMRRGNIGTLDCVEARGPSRQSVNQPTAPGNELESPQTLVQFNDEGGFLLSVRQRTKSPTNSGDVGS